MTQTTITPTKTKYRLYPLLSPEERIVILKSVRGMWKHRKPDPIKELQRLRSERERALISR